jgi:alkylation response protein AidB-like acyl-CoA dehydrogenase
MSFSFTDEQIEFRSVLRRFLEANAGGREARRLMATERGFEERVWRQLCDELGVGGICIPEEYGGQGFGFVEMGLVLEEMGRALLCAPFFSSCVMAALAVEHVGSDADKRALLPGLADGSRRATLALAETTGSFESDHVHTLATLTSDGCTLTGAKRFVVDGVSAEDVLVIARLPGTTGHEGLTLTLVNPQDAGVTRRPLEALDATRKLAQIEFSDAPARIVGEAGMAGPGLRRALLLSTIGLSCESVGGAQHMLASAVDYSLTRVQFGRLIGSFQAIKHQCAELLLDVELARSAAYRAAAAATENDPELEAIASLAKACTSENFMRASAECIQIHGGIGFTWEHDTHLWYRRAKSSEVFLGTPDQHRERMMNHWLPTGQEANA